MLGLSDSSVTAATMKEAAVETPSSNGNIILPLMGIGHCVGPTSITVSLAGAMRLACNVYDGVTALLACGTACGITGY